MKKFPIQYLTFYIIPIVFLDQITKSWALEKLQHSCMQITTFLSFTLSFNKGISFGILNQPNGDIIQQIILVIMSLVLIIILLFKANNNNYIPTALIVSGAFGNILDRITVHAVIDFIDIFYSKYHFPIFNIADIAICVGCMLLMIKS